MLPLIPKPGSRQYQSLVYLLNEWSRVWVVSPPGIEHKLFMADIAHLRKKGWPIEDDIVDDYHSPRAYRIDPERWRSLKSKFKDKFWLSTGV